MIEEFRLRRIAGKGIELSVIYTDGTTKKFEFPNWITAYSLLDSLG